MKKIEARYYLYTHWGVGNRLDDIVEYEQRKRQEAGRYLKSKPVFAYLNAARGSLDKLLTSTEGILFLFFDPGWKLALKPELDEGKGEEMQLRKAEEYSQAVLHLFAGGFSSRVRILNVVQLDDFIDALRTRHPASIFRWFLGEEGKAAYDSPKVVEAFLRTRFIGAGVPVLRVDWDVLVNVDENQRFKGLGITNEAIEASLKRDNEERLQRSTRAWICSAGYRRPEKPTYDEWSRAFATRVQPALLAKPEMCQLVYGTNFGLFDSPIKAPTGLTTAKAADHVDQIAEGCWNARLAEQYLGVRRRPNGSWEETDHQLSIAKLGAHPLHAIVSGALLNISAGAILDLPPFSNMTRSVMWIDDHLKFELHKALGHILRTGQPCRLHLSHTGGPWRPDDPPVAVVKGRAAPEPNLAAYTWASYLPTLLLGLVMDAWIRQRPGGGNGEPPLVAALRKAITEGVFDKRTAMKLEKSLREHAIERIREVHWAWSALMDGDTHTLASAWATSRVRHLVTEALQSDHPEIRVSEKSRGQGLIATAAKEIRAISDLSPPVADDLRELIWDAVEYIDLTLHWPGMIQTIRAVKETGIL